MWSYLFKRLLSTVPVFIGLSLIVFVIMAMIPGNPAQALLGAWATPENVARINQELGLNKPLWQQYLIWVGNMLHGDFGRSYVLNRPVIDEVMQRLGNTLILGGSALLIST
ncbi:ABC transporter permease, partial [Erwinia billingiae]